MTLEMKAASLAAGGGSSLIDPRDLIGRSVMSGAQKRAVALAATLSAVDGFDILSIAFVAPVLSHAFGIGSGALGLLLSSGLFGTIIGSVSLAAWADSIGRRPVVLISLLVMGLGMLGSALCTSFAALVAMRVLTGIGVGSMVVVINPLAAECANLHSRSLAISMMSIGYPLGGTLGGIVAALLLRHFDWRAVFLFGALMAMALFPIVIWKLPESLSFLIERQDGSSLARVNRLLQRFGHAPVAALPRPAPRHGVAYRAIFHGSQRPVTLFVSAISLMVFLAIYFFLSWQPKMLVELGFGAPAAATIAGLSSLAGAAATALFGFLSWRFSGLKLASLSFLTLGVAILIFGLLPPILPLLAAFALLAGGALAASTVGLFVIAADAFPTTVRSTGTGVMIGMGRVGSALAPALAGGLFALGLGRAGVCLAIAACALLATLMLAAFPHRARQLTADERGA